MSSIGDQNYQTQRQMRMDTEKETNQVINDGHKNVNTAHATQAVQGAGPDDSFTHGVQGSGQNAPRLSHAAPIPHEQSRDAANDNGRAVGNAMGSLSTSGNMGNMALQAQEMDVGYHKNERKTKQAEGKTEFKNRQDEEQQQQAKQEAAQQIAKMDVCQLSALVFAAQLEGKSPLEVQETKNQTNGQRQSGSQTPSKHEQMTQDSQNAWASPTPGQNQGARGRVQSATGPNGQPVVQRSPEGVSQAHSHSAQGSGRPAPNSHVEQAMFHHGVAALAQASDTLNAMPQSRKASQFG